MSNFERGSVVRSDHSLDGGWQREADRQRALLAAIHAGPAAQFGEQPAELPLSQAEERARRGMSVYRANAHALAERALAAAFPTLEKMVGAEEFPALARAHWQACPPDCGDIAEWGAALPDWLAARSATAPLSEWPWLADTARLDWAVHCCERAADGELDASTLARLGECDPAGLRLDLMPGTQVVMSDHPIVTIHAAHRPEDPNLHSADPFAVVRAALAEHRGERALVWRRGWRASVCALDACEAAWTNDVLAGTDLATALARHGEALDFSTWLRRAVTDGWLKGVALIGD